MRGIEQGGITWRAYRRLDSERAAALNNAYYTPAHQRTPKQERVIEDAQRISDKIQRRMDNVGIAQGRIHTSNGVAVFERGHKR